MQKLTRDEMAQRVARDIPEGAYVNLGIGLPTRIANYLPADKEVFLHSENGLLGMGPKPQPGEEDPELINAGKEYVTLLQGLLFPPRRLLRHDARRPSRYLRAGAYQVSPAATSPTGAPVRRMRSRPLAGRWIWPSAPAGVCDDGPPDP